MDRGTVAYYQENWEEVYERYEQVEAGVSEYFESSFEKGNLVLDIGCGSGRDVRRLLKQGFDAYGIDPCEEFINKSKEKNPERFFCGSIPDNTEALKDKKFDSVICSAVFMHIPDENLIDAVYSIKNLLNERGRVLLSIPHKREDLKEEQRDAFGRLMIIRDPWEIRLLFERIGFDTLQYHTNSDSMNRSGIEWTTFLFAL